MKRSLLIQQLATSMLAGERTKNEIAARCSEALGRRWRWLPPLAKRYVERFGLHVAAICLEEGFHVNHRKTRIMPQGVRQRVVGLVANQHPNVIRADFDQLKAIFHNCLRFGPAGQNRSAHADFRAHLEGRVTFVESINAARGERLRSLLSQIEW